jgi:hypothetical protein
MAAFPDAYSAEAAASALRQRNFAVDVIGGAENGREPVFSSRITRAIAIGAVAAFVGAFLLPMVLGLALSSSQYLLLLALMVPGGMVVGGFLAGTPERPLTVRERVLEREFYRDEPASTTAYLMVSSQDASEVAEVEEILRQSGAVEVGPAE